jgi:hypothetical protein
MISRIPKLCAIRKRARLRAGATYKFKTAAWKARYEKA